MVDDTVRDFLPETEILAQLGEEGSELSQAALKLRRAIDGTNPTPKSIDECLENLKEEFGDVLNCIFALKGSDIHRFEIFVAECWNRADVKYDRWCKRLEKRPAAPVGCPVCQNCGRPMVQSGSETIGGMKRIYYGCPVCCNQSCSRVVKLEEQKNG